MPEPAQLDRPDHLVGDEDVRKTCIGEHLGLAELGAQEALAAAAGDVLGQTGALQRLEVNAHIHRAVPEGAEHAFEIGIDDIEIDEQLRRVERVERLTEGTCHGGHLKGAGNPGPILRVARRLAIANLHDGA